MGTAELAQVPDAVRREGNHVVAGRPEPGESGGPFAQRYEGNAQGASGAGPDGLAAEDVAAVRRKQDRVDPEGHGIPEHRAHVLRIDQRLDRHESPRPRWIDDAGRVDRHAALADGQTSPVELEAHDLADDLVGRGQDPDGSRRGTETVAEAIERGFRGEYGARGEPRALEELADGQLAFGDKDAPRPEIRIRQGSIVVEARIERLGNSLRPHHSRDRG